MYFVIHCAGMPFDGNTIKHESLGGSESAACYLARELAGRGHRVTLFTASRNKGVYDGVRYLWMGECTQQNPFGELFAHFATKTPHDVLIIQRQPHAFATAAFASKINLLWTHDLATYSHKRLFDAGLPFIDRVLAVSDWHKAQIESIAGVQRTTISVLRNGVDLSLYDGPPQETALPDTLKGKKILLYTSRPERGLENLVRPDGIMEHIYRTNPEAHLLVAGYENTTPQMKTFYEYLWSRCQILPNVSLIGALSKPQLADLQKLAYLHVYPTEFEETSCITAMECAAAGLPFISTAVGALPETNNRLGAVLLKNSKTDVFTEAVVKLLNDEELRNSMSERQLAAASALSWKHSAVRLEGICAEIFEERLSNAGSVARHLIDTSDIYALKFFLENRKDKKERETGILGSVLDELEQCYGFMQHDSWRDHYDTYYQYEKQRGVDYGPENLDGNSRFEHIAREKIAKLPAGSCVLDYGCAHGHYTINLAKRFPDIKFTGLDISQSNIDIANKWKEDEGLSNVNFFQGEAGSDQTIPTTMFDFVLAGEVVEHVADPQLLVQSLCRWLKDGGVFCATTPYGPWEKQGYDEHWPWRAHVHHFEREDLREMCGHLKDYDVVVAPVSTGPGALGSYIWSFIKEGETKLGAINYWRKIGQLSPRQTVSLCVITEHDNTNTINMIKSALPFVDEVVIGIDTNGNKETSAIQSSILDLMARHRTKAFDFFALEESPSIMGFGPARNATVVRATGDWILWLDSDETLEVEGPGSFLVRPSQFNAISTPQIHYSIHPAAILKVDRPCRLFRNNRGIEFKGFVHEHPEIAVNEGIPPTLVQDFIAIGHPAYRTEPIRRKRFDRNIGLLAKDREINPNRLLGKFLWLRDLAQMNAREMEINGGIVTREMMERYNEGRTMWDEIVDSKHGRLIRDALEFYSLLLSTVHKGFTATVSTAVDMFNNAPPRPEAVTGRFFDREDYIRFFKTQLEDIVHVEEKYL